MEASAPHSSSFSSNRRRAPYAHKACEPCRAAKARCSAGLPCHRCQQLSKKCTYRYSLRRRPGTTRLLPAETTNQSRPAEQELTQPGELVHTDFAVYQLLHDLFRGSEHSSSVFHYRALLFASEVSPWDLMPFTTTSNPDLQFIPPTLAITSFNIYVSSLWYLNPFQSVDALQSTLCDIFGVVGALNASSGTDRANLLAILALGASCTGYYDFAQYAHLKSKEYAYENVAVVNMASVQHDLLQAQFHSHLNQHSVSYSILRRIRHRMCLSPTNGITLSLTGIMLVAFERYVSLCTGRPSIFPSELSFPDEAYPPALFAISKFAVVASQVHQAQHKFRGDLVSLSRASHELHQHLHASLVEISSRCRLPQSPPEVEVLVCVLFHYCILLIFRPFMARKLLHTFTAKPLTSECIDILDRACPPAVHAAKSLIELIGQTFHSGSVLKDLPPNGYFLESACLSLILAILCGYSSSGYPTREECLAGIRVGIGYISLMACQKTVADRLSSLRDLLSLVQLGAGGDFDADTIPPWYTCPHSSPPVVVVSRHR
ncbi:hypothetical protein BJX62DRAFT_193495 [Aspergillus germanicus]